MVMLCLLPFGACRSRPAAGPRDLTGKASTLLVISVRDAKSGDLLPARVRLVNGKQALELANHKDPPFCGGTGASIREIGPGTLAVWGGLLLWSGEGTIPVGVPWTTPATTCGPEMSRLIPFGSYRIEAIAGPNHEMGEASVELAASKGTVKVDVRLKRAIVADDYLAGDFHLHSGPVGSGDSAVEPRFRVMTGLAAGLQVMVSADHNYLHDLSSHLRVLVGGGFPSVAFSGAEADLGFAHFNIFPQVPRLDRPGNGSYFPPATPEPPVPAIAALRAAAGKAILQLNHPRFAWGAYFNNPVCASSPGASGWTDRSRPPPCPVDAIDSMEVLNGFTSCEVRTRASLDDWYALVRFGHAITAVGSSDAHTDSRKMAGYPRTYLRADVSSPTKLKPQDLVRIVRSRRAAASTAPWAEIATGEHRSGDLLSAKAGTLRVSVRVQFPQWAAVDEVHLNRDGVREHSWPVAGQPSPLSFEREVRIDRDTFLNVEAQGSVPMPPWVVGDFLQDEGRREGVLQCLNNARGGSTPQGMLPLVVTNPLFIDGDGDGKFHGREIGQ
jgi:hypothetical protein